MSTGKREGSVSKSAPPICIYLLGRFEVARGERVLRSSDWTRRKAAALLARLALERRLTKDQAIDMLWRDLDPIAGANNLYRTIHALRQTLENRLGPAADTVFAFEDGIFILDPSVWVDACEFEKLASGRNPDPQSAVELYAGDLLPDDLYSDWTQAPRESLRRLFRQSVLSLVASYQQARDYEPAINLLLQLVTRDPADEIAQRELIRIYALAGRRHEALRQYQILLKALSQEFDALPEPATSALYMQVQSGALSPLPTVPSAGGVRTSPLATQPSAMFVGREREFGVMHTLIRAALDGRGRTFLITGDPGVGKTLLLGEMLCAAAGAGMAVLYGAAYEQEGQWSYQPFIEAFDHYIQQFRLAAENPITHFKRIASLDPQQEQRVMFKAIITFLKDLAQPVFLGIDDLHAADEASLRLFHYLARSLHNMPLILLATYRSDVMRYATPFASLVNALYRERLSETITLTPLTLEASTLLLEQTLAGKASSDLATALYEITEGNPFYIQQVAQSLQKEQQIELREGVWMWRDRDRMALNLPADLSGLLCARVARLGALAEFVLNTAAVLGREFDYQLLRSATALADGELLNALDAALAARLLEETTVGYRFSHGLIRRALYDSLSRARRAHLHTRAAEAIETAAARDVAGVVPHIEALAFHYDLSDRRDRALDYLIRAGEKAAAILAFETAVNYYHRALDLMDALGLSDPVIRLKLLEALGWWENILADTPQAVARFEQALAFAPTSRDRVRLHAGAAITLITAGNLSAAETHLRQALAEVDESEDAAEYPDLLYNVAQFHWHGGEYRLAFEAAQKSLAIAERLNKSDAIARAFEMLALACHSLGEWRAGIQYEEKRAALIGSALDVSDAFDVHL